ncbi:glycosyltransferase family 1 protein [Homoserinibacter sp. GY 40078]|uniref:glycosyltransferase family 4 protein n=1 Tax=Homoserinibacter sp. GY 40078 TaxID=2603275 RepID=UPI0011C98A14|nr:glycosyltransferase family 1 protein [Homoserinibacter sp. GY 40078]TXK16254.1 glycosyltransferase family 4 protein [Homoserinibacter sp. GY 40078]
MSSDHRPLRVLVDATSMPPDLGGVGRYLEHLVPALAARADTQIVVAAQERDAAWFREASPSARVVTPVSSGSRLKRLLWEQTGLPRLAARERVDVIHAPHYTMPIATRIPVVVTVHDATFFSHPELHTRVKRTFFRTWTRISSRRARAIVVPSHATAEELARSTRVDAPVVVAHHGVDGGRFRPPTADEVARVATTLSVPDGWIAFLGTVEPRKNVAALVRGYAALAERMPLPPLVIGGAPGWDTETASVIERLPSGIDVRLGGYLDADLLPGFLGGAEVVAYPSLGEGFGLPVLEAMASGAAVLTTRALALPEVGGDAVAYTEPDADAISSALERLLGDPDERKELARRAIARAAEFTWSASAEAHASGYRQAVGAA